MSDQLTSLVDEFYKAFGSTDLELLSRIITEDFTVDLPVLEHVGLDPEYRGLAGAEGVHRRLGSQPGAGSLSGMGPAGIPSPHQAIELQRPVLHDDDREVVAVLDHQEPSVGGDVLALVSHQVQRVRAIEEFDGR